MSNEVQSVGCRIQGRGSPSVVLLYHYFHPDDVVSARLFSDFAVQLKEDGWDVTAMPSVRSCHDERQVYPRAEVWEGGRIWRVWRPGWRQSSNKGRVGNAIAVLAGWTWRSVSMRRRHDETMIVGTDPILAVLITIPWRLFRPKSRIIFWCHDLYPQAAIADGLLTPSAWSVRVLNVLLRFAYRRCDVIADLGSCMRKDLVRATGAKPEATSGNKIVDDRLSGRDASANSDCPQHSRGTCFVTRTPWALVEPKSVVQADSRVREQLFEHAQLGLLYSGNLGRAHEYELFLTLSRALRGDSVAVCFAGRGSRMDELRGAISEDDSNIYLGGFASEEELELRLGAADIHLVSLRESWTGTVVPSKFFGAIAMGRPILFLGSLRCAIAQWIEKYQLGWVLTKESLPAVAEDLRRFAKDASAREEMNHRCFQVYHAHFSKYRQMANWRESLLRQPTEFAVGK